MKTRFSTVDIKVSVNELQRYLSLRVVNVYDVDHKTYLIKLALPDKKAVLVIESGIRIHSTEFEWPKHAAPSGFAMKLRKHLRGRRLESIQQLGIDRIIDLQFGSSDAAYHVILELYDRGNIALTDYEYTILNILRPRSNECQDVKLVVREKYPLDHAKDASQIVPEKIRGLLQSAKDGDQLKRILLPATDFGPAIIEHCLLEVGFRDNIKLNKGFNINTDFEKLMDALQKASELFEKIVTGTNKGYIIQKRDVRPVTQNEGDKELLTYDEFHPYLFSQYAKKPYIELEMFDKSVDEFFSKLETQKIDMKILQQEKMAVKKLENVKKDHEKRMQELQKVQESDTVKGQFIECNLTLVDKALTVVRSAVANQINWTEINELVKQAQSRGDPVALAIKTLKLNTNHITMLLSDPYIDSDEEEEEGHPKSILVDIDLGLSAYANSKKYFDKKKQAAKKEQKTIDASAKALKSAERKTKETLKNVATAATINKARKTYWFEKFLWFISSENYVVVGGRDQQQNEMVVKRYMRPGDIYVHADLHGASSVILKNPSGDPIPPKTLNEAGSMAICNSAAWDAKVVTSAWWVYHDQVSKTAPTGEYLTTGSFMIRGKKNYLPPSHLIYGFGLLFKLEDGSVFRHAGERKVRGIEEESLTKVEEEDSNSGVDDSKTNEESANEADSNKEDSSDSQEEEEEEDDDEEEISDEKNGILPEPQNSKEKPTPKKNDVAEKDLEEFAFPDTSINLDFSGEKLMVRKSQTGNQNESYSSATKSKAELAQEAENKSVRLSAKTRRDMKKSRKKGVTFDEFLKQKGDSVDESSRKTSEKDEEEPNEDNENIPSNISSQTSQQPLKRGKRNKMKRMKEKYKDQDEEERLLRMEILASAGPAKEEKKKKGKKDKKPQKEIKMRGHIPEKLKITPEKVTKEHVDGTVISAEGQVPNSKPGKDNDMKQEEEEEEDDKPDEDDLSHQVVDAQILDSLTGCPVNEDELLYSVCMVAPYNSILNYKNLGAICYSMAAIKNIETILNSMNGIKPYKARKIRRERDDKFVSFSQCHKCQERFFEKKYKVKLLPGTTKRGKAAKTAVANFLHDKSATSREKDLIKILKDSDISRNIPGKVKIAAPNLLKNKRKK